jgi:hypothetical protein
MSTATINKQLDNVVSNMSPAEQAVYTRKIAIGYFEDVKNGKISMEECNKNVEHTIDRIVKPMDYQKCHEYFVGLHKDAIQIAIDTYKELDRNHKMAAIFATDATRHFLEETINHEATKSAWCEERLYQSHPASEAAKLVKEDIEMRKECMLPVFQGLKQAEQERTELLDPKIWEDLGGVPDVESYQTILLKKVQRICADLSILPDEFIDSNEEV